MTPEQVEAEDAADQGVGSQPAARRPHDLGVAHVEPDHLQPLGDQGVRAEPFDVLGQPTELVRGRSDPETGDVGAGGPPHLLHHAGVVTAAHRARGVADDHTSGCTSGACGYQPRLSVWAAAGLVVGGSLLLGGLTSLGQTYLPDWLRSLSNSMGGWTVFAFLLVGVSGVRPRLGAVLGAVSFVTLNAAYGIVSNWRGFYYADPLHSIWTYVGLVTGPVLGVAASHRQYVGRT